MDFFEHQDRARRNTGLLVFFYVLAVMAIMLGVYLVFALTLGIAGQETPEPGATATAIQLWYPELFFLVMAGTLVVVLGGTTYKVLSLSRGGISVANLLGGRQINRNTTDPDEQKVLNVVEEMAIAAGTPVPPVFLLEQETGINAFAAGFAPADAVIGITQGAIRQLSRDELQGVIAHEFSHILNGDMRLNIRLMGVLHGILLIGLIGYWMLRSSMYAGAARSSSKGGKNSQGQIMIIGLALTIIGFVGVFFGKLIKSAVSRQREFLADAAAVQFTRNPDGIAGALQKIGGYDSGSKITDSHAEEASHLFFANGLASSFLSLLSTHPPLKERIRRLDRNWEFEQAGKTAKAPAARAGSKPASAGSRAMGFAAVMGAVSMQSQKVVDSVGTPQKAHLNYAVGLMAALPPDVKTAAHEPFGARAVIYNLLLSKAPDINAQQLQTLEKSADPAVYQETLKLTEPIGKLATEMYLPLADMAIATLKELSQPQYQSFNDNIEKLIIADKQVSLFEYTIHRMILRHLTPFFKKTPQPTVRYHSIQPLMEYCVDALSCLAHWGDEKGTEAQKYFDQGFARLAAGGKAGTLPAMAMRAKQDCSVGMLDKALQTLAESDPTIKKRVMDACVSCVAANGTVSAAEGQVLRAVGDYLGCPVPPVMAGA